MTDSNPLRNFTLLGRLWIIACIGLGTFVFIAYVSEMLPILPAGQYPVVWFLVPVVLGSLVLYAIGTLFFRMIGIKIRREPSEGTKE